MGKVLKVREVGDPVLYEKCTKVDIKKIDKSILDMIDDMKATLNFTGGFGIAAPQVGINKRIVIIQVKKEKCSYEDSEEIPTTVMINPTWRKLSEQTKDDYEGCLSVPQIRGKVKRYIKIEITYYTEKGVKVVKEAKGFTARDIQHECDHLDGILFLEKVVKQGFASTDMIGKYELRKK